MDAGRVDEVCRTALLSTLQNSKPERCVRLSHCPSIQVYYALKARIEQSSPQWLLEFLELAGLEALLDNLLLLAGSKFTSISDAVMQLDCLACVRAVLNTKVGINYFIRQDDYTRKLALALDTPNTLPKKQVIEVLTALCVFSNLGYTLVLDSLDHFHRETSQSSRFYILISELKLSDTPSYRTTLMSLVNALIGGTPDTRERSRMRNEFIALGLLDIIQFFHREDRDPDLCIQLEIFDDLKKKDEERLSRQYNFDVLSHRELFNALNEKVFGTPERIPFLHILQDLYTMDTNSCVRSLLWPTLAKATHYMCSLKDKAEIESAVERLESLFTHSGTKNSEKKNKPGSKDNSTGSKELEWHNADEIITCSPDLRGGGESNSRRDSGISVWSSTSPLGDSGREGNFTRQGSGRQSLKAGTRLEKVEEDQELMLEKKPALPVKPVKWVKVPADKANGRLSVWKMSREYTGRKPLQLNYSSMEWDFEDAPGLKDADDEVQLLDGKQSLALNMFLARMEMTPEELCGCITEADLDSLGLEAVRTLVKILPTQEEILQLQCYTGPRFDLGPAEQFLLNLSDLPDYQVYISGLVFKAEFATNFTRLKSAFESMIRTCQDVLHHPGLRDFVKVLLQAGNFMNASSHLGRANGIRLDTWCRLAEVKGKDQCSLLDMVIQQVAEQDEDVLFFATDFPTMKQASKHSLEEMKTEVTQMTNQLKKLLQQLSSAGPRARAAFDCFIEDVKGSLEELHTSITRLRSMSQRMAYYFCEDEAKFDLQLCLQRLNDFCHLVRKSRKETRCMKSDKEIVARRRKWLAEFYADKQTSRLFGKTAGMCSSFAIPQTDGVLDQILERVHQGNLKGPMSDELITPDMEENPLLVSQIAADATTREEPEEDEEEVDSTFIVQPEARAAQERKTYHERADAVILQQYRRNNQVSSSSYIHSERIKMLKPHAGDDGPLKIYRKHAERPTTLDLPQIQRLQKSHKRSNSDLDRSTSADIRWVRYEKEHAKVGHAKVDGAQPESESFVTSLSLEQHGRALSRDDMLDLEQVASKKVPNNKENVRKKRRGSLGIFKRLSRALKPRDSNIPEADSNKTGKAVHDRDDTKKETVKKDSKNKCKKSKKGKLEAIDKENSPVVKVKDDIVSRGCGAEVEFNEEKAVVYKLYKKITTTVAESDS